MRLNKGCLRLSVLLLSLFLPVSGFSQPTFYEGKTITILVGTSAGGVGDLRVRALAPFLQKHIPGNPIVVVENMAGAGGRRVANNIFKTARPDGLTIGGLLPGTVPDAIMGEAGVFYEIDKFIYLGTPNRGTGHTALFTRKEAGLDSIEKLRTNSGTRIGAPNVGHPHYFLGRLFAYVLRMTSPRFVTGYSGPEIDIALLRGEVDGRAHSPDTILLRNADWIEKKLVDFNVMLSLPRGSKHPHPAFARLPELRTFAKTAREQKLLDLYEAFRTTGSPLVLPPGTPKDRATMLQDALRKVFKDPEFYREFRKLTGHEAEVVMPDELVQAIRDLPRETEIIDLYKTIAGAEPLPAVR